MTTKYEYDRIPYLLAFAEQSKFKDRDKKKRGTNCIDQSGHSWIQNQYPRKQHQSLVGNSIRAVVQRKHISNTEVNQISKREHHGCNMTVLTNGEFRERISRSHHEVS